MTRLPIIVPAGPNRTQRLDAMMLAMRREIGAGIEYVHHQDDYDVIHYVLPADRPLIRRILEVALVVNPLMSVDVFSDNETIIRVYENGKKFAEQIYIAARNYMEAGGEQVVIE